MDYWKDVKKIEYPDKETFLSTIKDKECWFFSAHGTNRFTDISFPKDKDVYLIFGKESVGLGREILDEYSGKTLRIPMKEGERCLNLSNSVAVAVYECLRQWNYPDFL